MTETLQDRLASLILGIRGVVEHPSQFSPTTAFWIDGREFAHFHGRRVELRLTRKVIGANRTSLKEDARVELGSADWIHVRLARADDVPLACGLARLAAEANRRKPGETRRAIPGDRELGRRRRSHGQPTRDLER